MQKLQSVSSLMQPNCYMAIIDLKEAYYSVKTDETDTAYLKFSFNSISCFAKPFIFWTKKFTKLTKSLLALQRLH